VGDGDIVWNGAPCADLGRDDVSAFSVLWWLRPWFLVAPFLVVLMPAAQAQSGWIDEAKLGLTDHDIGFGDHHVERGPDINGEALFASPSFLDTVGAPRPDLGVSVNTAGRTSYAYAGLTWTVRPWRWLFAGFGLGGAVQDGQLDGSVPGHKSLGSRGLFRESVELGYQFTSALSLSLFLDHISNANLARHNQGLTNFGLRTGYRF